jgi:hypothetical protein
MQHVQMAIDNPTCLAISSYACKGIEIAVNQASLDQSIDSVFST